MSSAQQLARQGLECAGQGRLEEAARLLAQAADLEPGNPAPRFNLGLVQQQRGLHEDAVRAFDAVLALQPAVAQAHHARGIALKNLGRHAQALASYDEALRLAPGMFAAHNNRGVVLKHLGRLDEALASYEAALALQPQSAEVHNNAGIVLHELARYQEALAAFERSLAQGGETAPVLMNAAVALHQLRRYDEAHAFFARALRLAPGDVDVRLNLGNTLAAQERTEEALAAFREVLAARPEDADAMGNLANTLRDAGRHAEALPWYDKAVGLYPGHAGLRWNRSLSLLASGDFARGWQDYEWRWKAEKLQGGARVLDAPLWLGREPLQGRTLLLHAEQGLGDTLQFCRYAALLAQRGAQVVLEVQPPLVPLLAGLAGVARVVARGTPLPPHDFQCPLMSLPLALGTAPDTIPWDGPYLRADPALVAHWKGFLAGSRQPQIGLSWSGNPAYWNDHRRSMTLAGMRAALPEGFGYWQLQKDNATDAQKDIGPPVQRFAQNDFPNTAAQICALDAVISVDTSIGHLAGALGRPVFLLLSRPADARWMEERADSPWYPSARLIRQQVAGDWAPVFRELAQALAALAALPPT